MAIATTEAEGSAFESTISVLTEIVKFIVTAVVAIVGFVWQAATICPAVAVGLAVFIGACFVPLTAVPESMQPFLATYFPYIAAVGAVVLTLCLTVGGVRDLEESLK